MILEYISKNPLTTLIGLILSFAGIIVAVVVAYLQKKRKQLGYRFNTTVIVKENQFKETRLNIQFNETDNEKQIGQLSETRIEIRNIGNVGIDERYDIYEEAKLKIVPETKGLDIICAKVGSESDSIIKCTVAKTNNEIEVHFNAIEANKSVVINVYHSGDRNEKFIVSGRIKDGEIVRLKAKDDNSNTLTKILDVLCLFNALFFLVLLSRIPLADIVNCKVLMEIILYIACIVLCCSNIVMTVISYVSIKAFPND